MTREVAIAVAREFVKREGLSVDLEPYDIRLQPASRYNKLLGREVYPCDFWIVEFIKILGPGVAIEFPASTCIEVVSITGVAREVYPGMNSE